MNRTKYFTPRDVALHCTADDLWVSLLGKVLDLTQLVSGKSEDGTFPLLVFAGKDISHLFDEDGEVKLHVDPNTNKISPFSPFNSIIDSPSQEEAEKLYWERKREDEEAAASIMRIYMFERLGDEQMRTKSSIPKVSSFEERNAHDGDVDSITLVSAFTSEKRDSSDEEHNGSFSFETQDQATASLEVNSNNDPSDDILPTSHSIEKQNHSENCMSSPSEENQIRKRSSSEQQDHIIIDHSTDPSLGKKSTHNTSFSETISSSHDNHNTFGSVLPVHLTEIQESNINSSNERRKNSDINEPIFLNEKRTSDNDSSSKDPFKSSSYVNQSVSVSDLPVYQSEENRDNYNARFRNEEQELSNTILTTMSTEEKAPRKDNYTDDSSDILTSTENQNLPDSVLPLSSAEKYKFMADPSVEEQKQSSTSRPAALSIATNVDDDEHHNDSSDVSSSIETQNISNSELPISSAEKHELKGDSSVEEQKQSNTLQPAELSNEKNKYDDEHPNNSSGVSPLIKNQNISNSQLPISSAEKQELKGDSSVDEQKQSNTLRPAALLNENNKHDDEHPNNSSGVSSSIEIQNNSSNQLPISSAEKQEHNEHSSASEQMETHNDDISDKFLTNSSSFNDKNHHSITDLPSYQTGYQENHKDMSERGSSDQKSVLSDFSPLVPWWKDSRYIVGFVTRKARRVCSEDTIEDIVERYLKFNSNAHNYAWKYLGRTLNMRENLEKNGIQDCEEIASRLRLDSEDFIPTLTLYFSDSIE